MPVSRPIDGTDILPSTAWTLIDRGNKVCRDLPTLNYRWPGLMENLGFIYGWAELQNMFADFKISPPFLKTRNVTEG